MGFLSAEHILPIAAMVIAAAVCIAIARRNARSRVLPYLRRALALLILGAWAGEYIYDAAIGIWSVKYDLPLQLTDAVSIVTVLALWTGRRRAVELAYLWAMTASLQAILTPDLTYEFPQVLYLTYFTYHCAAVVGACLLVLGERRTLPRAAVGRAYLAALGWACLAAIADLATGGNYMYLRARPEHNSLLSLMGAWPWYVIETALVLAPLLLWALWGLTALVERLGARATPDGPQAHARQVVQAD